MASSSSASNSRKKQKKVPSSVLRFFPIKKRLQRLFASSKTAEHMTWHADERNDDGHLRHPADSEEWKRFDNQYPDFANEPRNVRLGLSSDGFEPFRSGPESHSIWPVFLVVYNLPPWMCMKPYYTQMSRLIPGPFTPSQSIDVYLKPLVEELKDLWSNGIRVYDAHKKEWFTMRAALLWTINDFPAYSMLSGWSTRGYLACPICQGDTHCEMVGRRYCYTGNRRHLERDHPYRRSRRHFDGRQNFKPPLPEPTGLRAYEAVRNIQVTFGKTKTDTLADAGDNNWRKNTVFHELPYWSFLNLRYNLDVMHIEKNVCELLLNTLLTGKQNNKVDTLEARKWFEQKGLRPELHPIDKGGGRLALPPAKYTMSSSEKEKFLKVLKTIRVPDGYSANISKCVNLKEKKLNPLKSHDCHVIMQQILPVAIRVLSDSDVVSVITDLCHFFREICSKDFTGDDFKILEKKIVRILCRIEMLFPPTIFTIMLHLCLHLPREARLGGPVVYRYMYPFERLMFKLKKYIRNKSRPAGSIAEGWLAEECIGFCSTYLQGVENVFNRPSRNDDVLVMGESNVSVFRSSGKIIGATTMSHLVMAELDTIHRWVLFNCQEIDEFISLWDEQYVAPRGQRLPKDKAQARNKFFPSWLREHVDSMEPHLVNDDLKALAFGPDQSVEKLSGYCVNGYRFHTQDRDRSKKFQNCGVHLTSSVTAYASARDRNPNQGILDYYGVLQEIVRVRYRARHIVLFKCKWHNVHMGN